MTKFKDMVLIFGLMDVRNTLELGYLVKCMAKAILLGPMVEATKDNIKMMKNTVMEAINSQMGGLIKEIGKQAELKAKVFLLGQTVGITKENI